MQDFTFCIPTCFLFGEGSPAKVGAQAARYGRRVLIHHDGGEYLSCLLDTVRRSLRDEGLEVFELSGVVSSPQLSLVLQGAELCRKEKIDCVLAVGGGSVMDSAKAIAFMAVNNDNFTDYVSYKRQSEKCLPVGCIVTLSGTGSEVSATAMIVDDTTDRPIKYPLFQDSIRFRFAILDPSLTTSLPIRQTLSGAFDAITHVLERYFCGVTELQGRMGEAVVISTMNSMRAVIDRPDDFDIRAQLQLTATLANSGLIGVGEPSDWAMHYIENPITTATHNPHGSTLAIIAPAWMRYCRNRHLDKAVTFAQRIMGVTPGKGDEDTAAEGIDAFTNFLTEVGLPTRLSHIEIKAERFPEFAKLAVKTASGGPVGGVSKLSLDEIIEIYRIAQ